MLKKLFLVIVLLGLMAAGAVLWVLEASKKQALQPLPLTEKEYFNVPSGTSFMQLMQQLQERGWIEHLELMRVYVRLHPEITSIRAGEYEIQPGQSLRDVLEKMNRGEVVAHYFTLVEGHTFKQLLAAIAADARFVSTLEGLSEAEVMALLGAPEGVAAEGQFLAETYQFNRGSRDIDLLRRAYQALHGFLDQQWELAEKGLPYRSAYEALIMASIIEKETGVPSERPRIAGVFVRRLNLGMRLQTDPTVIYGMGDAYQGRITRADLQRPTPWNTYTIPALPPTPISMVGREAITAALNPEDGDELYFVAKGDGTHHFSRTLREHNNAVNRYQRNRRSDYRSSPGG
ncbi:endolytic transglycosylase MltG [Nitrincola nitratireducens]|uniref:Endolytic murein transglycosylase n=1 Tax=Nitrincola nitratireducens TaxID=1229521 RepID=W9V370_9GAMM|nr:endolytic transglycosylase MltG [Nitrincola nitratireducens]EXJ11366.1 hypothetical protein D791_01821 [Nitrincola nitratireducens]